MRATRSGISFALKFDRGACTGSDFVFSSMVG